MPERGHRAQAGSHAILDGGTTYAISTGSGRIDEQHAGAFVERSAGLAHGLGYWAVLPAVLIAVTWLLFRCRDLS